MNAQGRVRTVSNDRVLRAMYCWLVLNGPKQSSNAVRRIIRRSTYGENAAVPSQDLACRLPNDPSDRMKCSPWPRRGNAN